MSKHRDTEVRHRSVSKNTSTQSPIDRSSSLEKTYEIVFTGKEKDDHTKHGFMEDVRQIYEQHFRHLHDQLEAVTIEKENIASQLKHVEAANEKLQQRICDLEKHLETWKDRRESDKHKESESQSLHDVKSASSKYSSWKTGIVERMVSSVYQLADDFKTTDQLPENGEDEGEPLTAKSLKGKMSRFGKEFKPYIKTVRGIQNLLMWKWPSYTLVVFMVYMYVVWTGRFLQVLAFCLAFRHFICLLQSMGLRVEFSFFPAEVKAEKLPEMKLIEEVHLALEVARKAQEKVPEMKLFKNVNFALEVARKLQYGLDTAADILEKIKSVLMWRHLPGAMRIFLLPCFIFISSFFISVDSFSTLLGIGIGIRLFIMNYFYTTFPRLNEKYNSTHKLWKELPTQTKWEKQQAHLQNHQTEKESTEEEKETPEPSLPAQSEEDISKDDQKFCQLFFLPESERPLEGWKGGKRCSLVNKEKLLISAFQNGKLYLTRSFLCFERTRKPSKRNIVIPLADVTIIQKAKPYSRLPGSSMAIEVVVRSKAFIFGGIINRDEAFENIQEQGSLQSLPWATGHMPTDGASNSRMSNLVRRSSAGKYSFPDEYEEVPLHNFV